MSAPSISAFVRRHYKHFNAAALCDAADAYADHVGRGGQMLVTLAGAMSTAELGKSLAAMIRAGKVHAISTTGANLEEDLFNLVAHDHYVRVPRWRDLTPADEKALLDKHLNRVTDTCIPEEEAMRAVEKAIFEEWQAADQENRRHYPHEFLYRVIRSGVLEDAYQIDPMDSWLVAAAEADLPIVTPGWEDSTLGNFFAGHCITGAIADPTTMRNGIEAMIRFQAWYRQAADEATQNGAPGIGFFQIGGGIAGDFPICVVPMIHQDLQEDAPLWGYFCQISDSTTSYGSYSGAVPNEKITWGKLAVDTPSFIVESDATIVAPLVFQMVLEADPAAADEAARGYLADADAKRTAPAAD